MKFYHMFFYVIKVILVILVLLMYSGLISFHNKVFSVIDKLFKISIGAFILYFFTVNKFEDVIITTNDRIIIIMAGIVLMLSGLSKKII